MVDPPLFGQWLVTSDLETLIVPFPRAESSLAERQVEFSLEPFPPKAEVGHLYGEQTALAAVSEIPNLGEVPL